MTSPYVMAVDLGVTNVRAGLVNRSGRVTHYTCATVAIEQGAAGVAARLVDASREVLHQAGCTTRDLVAVGCSVPGCVNPEDGVIVTSATPGWEGADVRGPLEHSFGRQVTVEGDGASATLAFHTFGPTRGQNHLLGICIGTSISCGFITDGSLVRGAGHAALDAGHMPLFPEGRICSCGRRGCWETVAGGGALRHILAELREVGHQLPALPEELAELAHASHDESIRLWDEQGILFGLGIAVLLNVLNPRTVVLGGGVSRSWSLFKKSLLRTARERAMSRNSQAAIVCAPNPELSSLLGAAVAATQAQGRGDFFVDATSIPPVSD